MPGLFGLISKDIIPIEKTLKVFNNSLCAGDGSKNEWHYHDDDKKLLIGWKGNENFNISEYCYESKEIVVSISGWIASSDNNNIHAIQIANKYRKHGISFLRYINGQFFLFLWDKREKLLFLATDHFGLRPHYWCNDGSTLSFAYETGALIAVNSLDESLDLTALSQFLSYEYILQERTWHPKIKLIPPRSYLLASGAGDYKIERYWKWEDINEESAKITNETDLLESSRYAFNNAVKKCYSNAPEGVLITLSGGLDTRALISAADYTRTQTITHGSPNSANRIIARDIAENLGVKHLEYNIDTNWMPERAKHLVWLTSGHESLRHTHSHSYHQQIGDLSGKIMIGGLGGEFVRAFFYNFGQFAIVGKRIFEINKNAQYDFLAKLLHIRMTYGALSKTQKTRLLRPEILKDTAGKDYDTILEIIRSYGWWSDIFDQLDRFYLEQRVRRFIINGQLYTWNHIESRWPFMDIDFVSTASKLPHEWKIGSRFHRYLIAKNSHVLMKIPHDATMKPLTLESPNFYYLQKFLPWNKKDSKFDKYTNYPSWFRQEWKDWTEELILAKNALCHEYFIPTEIAHIWQNHLNGMNNSRILSILITIELWLKLQKHFCNTK